MSTNTIADPMRRFRACMWALLIFGTAASLAGNITHAVILHAGTAAIGPIIAAVLAPVALLGLVHAVGIWVRDSGQAGRGVMGWILLAAITGLAATAFRLSFSALRDLASSYGYDSLNAALVPVMLDGLIVVCTAGLVAAAWLTATAAATNAVHASLDQPTAATEPSLLRTPTQDVTEPSGPQQLPAAPTVHVPVVQVQEPTRGAVHQLSAEVVHQTVNLSTTCDDQVTDPAADPVVRSAGTVVQVPTRTVVQEPVVHTAAPEPDPVHEPVVHAPTTTMNHGGLTLVNQSADPDLDHRARAEAVVAARSGSDWTVAQVETVSRNTPGLSQRKLAEEIDSSPATVNRMRKALESTASEIA